jgi:GxxExxY protein
MGMLIDASFNSTTKRILDAAIEVHRTFGPGLLESAYLESLQHELTRHSLRFESERTVPLIYKGQRLRTRYRVDLIVEDLVVVEVKAVASRPHWPFIRRK